MQVGVSLYPSFLTKQQIENKITKLAKYHIDLVFTSIQLDNLNFQNAKNNWDNFIYFFKLCKNKNIKISVDVSKDAIGKLAIKNYNDLANIKKLGIYSLRLDDGFSDDEILEMTKNKNNIKIELNASMTLDLEKLLNRIKSEGNIKNVIAAHNFFPRENTGLSYQRTLALNQIIKQYKVPISGFVATPSSTGKLCITNKGVPTIEEHRYRELQFQLEDFKVLGFDFAIISEDDYTIADLEIMNCISCNRFIYLYIKDAQDDRIFEHSFSLRPDQPEFVRRFLPRLTEINQDTVVSQEHVKDINMFDVTLDNKFNGRYSGEIQISLSSFPQKKHINVIGKLVPEQKFIINSDLIFKHKVRFHKI